MAKRKIDIVVSAKDQASGKLSTLSKVAIAGLAAAAAKVAFEFARVAATKIVETLQAATKAASEQQKVEAQLAAVLRSTQHAAGLTAEQLRNMADAMEDVTAFQDKTVQSAQNILLTFTKIGRDVFPQALETVLDMSAAMGDDLKASSIRLGKALNDPILGVTALREVGVNFNEAQTEVIKKMARTGDIAGAQALILRELAVEFGGSARAAGETFAGGLDKLANAWDDVLVQFGSAVTESDAATASMSELRAVVKEFGDFLESNGPAIRAAINQIILGIVEAVPPAITSIRGLAEGFAIFARLKGFEILPENFDESMLAIEARAELAAKNIRRALFESEFDRLNPPSKPEGRITAGGEEAGGEEDPRIKFARETGEKLREMAEVEAEAAIGLAGQVEERKQELINSTFQAFLASEIAVAETQQQMMEAELELLEEQFRVKLEMAAGNSEAITNIELERLNAIAALDIEHKKDQKKRDAQTAKDRIENFTLVANAMANLTSQLFGQNKATAIASAIINTAEGVTKALGQGGIFGIVLGAIVAAAGAIQISKIKSQEMAAGGIVPFLQGSVAGRDSVPALLTPGELVIPEPIVRSLTSQPSPAIFGGANVSNSETNASINLITDSGEGVGGDLPDTVEELIEAISDAVERTGARLVASRVTTSGGASSGSRL